MSNESPMRSYDEAVTEFIRLDERSKSAANWAGVLFFIGGTSLIGGLVAQVVPWEPSDADAARTGGWYLAGAALVLLVVARMLLSSAKDALRKADALKRQHGFISTGDPSDPLDDLMRLEVEDPETYRLVMAQLRLNAQRRQAADPDSSS